MALAPTAGVSGNNGLLTAEVGQEQFFKLMMTQLLHQDPLKPMDHTAFISQLAQFSSLALAQQSNDSLSQLAATQSQAQAIGLLNRTVNYRIGAGTTSGRVESVTFDQRGMTLTVGSTTGVTLDRIEAVNRQ
jgi:flagellar basal-body rod modification protein FlgD